MRFIVYANKSKTITYHAKFTVDADSVKVAEKKIKEELECSCLAERLRLPNENTEEEESKISVFAEEIDEFNSDELDNIEHVDFPKIVK